MSEPLRAAALSNVDAATHWPNTSTASVAKRAYDYLYPMYRGAYDYLNSSAFALDEHGFCADQCQSTLPGLESANVAILTQIDASAESFVDGMKCAAASLQPRAPSRRRASACARGVCAPRHADRSPLTQARGGRPLGAGARSLRLRRRPRPLLPVRQGCCRRACTKTSSSSGSRAT